MSSKMGDFYQRDIILSEGLIELSKTKIRKVRGIKLIWVVKTQSKFTIVNWILSRLDHLRGRLPLRFKLWDKATNFKAGPKETEISKQD